ncbi:MAG: MerR family transcriptional regulator [Cryomorphaceae bacterium]|nr:MerR family transcriptional regulator [Cryomorphaceae bacterium]
MSTPEFPPDKLYFSIGEVADMFGINTSNLRYWEKEFNFINPRKNRKGNRVYNKQDIESIRLLYHLTKEKGYTIEGARKVLDAQRQKVETTADISARLRRIRQELIDLRDRL